MLYFRVQVLLNPQALYIMDKYLISWIILVRILGGVETLCTATIPKKCTAL